MKRLGVIFFFLFISGASLAMDSDSKVLLKSFDKKFENYKKEPLAFDKSLRKCVSHYEKSLDKDFLLALLKRYDRIFKVNKTYYVVEMFYDLYKKDKKKFGVYLDEALSQKNKKVFLDRIKIVVAEQEGGNG
jgi:hypothetical protein